MGNFSSAAEVDKYIGGMFRHAADHPEVGPKLKAADIVLKVIYEDPACELTVVFRDPMLVAMGDQEHKADISLFMRADIADQYWRGQYNLAVGLAKGQVKAKGRVPGPVRPAGRTAVRPAAQPRRKGMTEDDRTRHTTAEYHADARAHRPARLGADLPPARRQLPDPLPLPEEGQGPHEADHAGIPSDGT